MHVLFRTEYGSSLYGTATPQSDKDYITIFKPPLTDVLLGNAPMRVKCSSTAGNAKNTSADTDERFVSVQKFAREVFDGKQWATEVLFSALDQKNLETLDAPFKKLCATLPIFVGTHSLLGDKAVDALLNEASKAAKAGNAKGAYTNLRLVATSVELRRFGMLVFPMLHAKDLLRIKTETNAYQLELHVEMFSAVLRQYNSAKMHPALVIGERDEEQYRNLVGVKLADLYASDFKSWIECWSM